MSAQTIYTVGTPKLIASLCPGDLATFALVRGAATGGGILGKDTNQLLPVLSVRPRNSGLTRKAGQINGTRFNAVAIASTPCEYLIDVGAFHAPWLCDVYVLGGLSTVGGYTFEALYTRTIGRTTGVPYVMPLSFYQPTAGTDITIPEGAVEVWTPEVVDTTFKVGNFTVDVTLLPGMRYPTGCFSAINPRTSPGAFHFGIQF